MRKSIGMLSGTAGVFLALLVGGCGPQRTTATSLRDQPEEYAQFVVLDRGVRKWLRVEGRRVSWTDDNRLRADVKVMNLSASDKVIHVKFKFKDSGGFDIDETNWMPKVLVRKEITTISFTSLSEKARNFTVLFRERRTGF